MIKYFFQTLFQKLKLSFLISIIVIIITLPFNMSYLSILEYIILCFIVVFCYSIIEGINFTDFFSHSGVRTYSWTPRGVKKYVHKGTKGTSLKRI